MDSLGDRWKTAGSVILDPWFLLLFVVLGLLTVAVTTREDSLFVGFLSAITSVVAGVLGGVATRRWSQLTEEKVISARGQTAVRSLKLLLTHVTRVERRTLEFQQAVLAQPEGEDYLNPELVAHEFGEVVGQCRLLQDQVLSAIENWTDLVDEADIRTQVGIITELRDRVDDLKGQIDELEDVLSDKEAELSDKEAELSDKEGAEEEAARLREEINEKRSELRNAKRQLVEQSYQMIPGSTAKVTVSDPPDDRPRVIDIWSESRLGRGTSYQCRSCGHQFTDSIWTIDGPSCPKCGSGDTMRDISID